MQAGYLYLNAGLYLLFAVWCTFAPAKTSIGLGYELLSRGGRSEYLVIYGGLQLGLALIFWLLARNADFHRFGLLAALALYGPIVVYRAVTIGLNWPVGGLTLATGVLEAVLLVAAIWIYRQG
jgi:hypothetical protein